MNQDIKAQLDYFLTDPNRHVVNAANHVLTAAQQLADGNISKSEFKELMQDVLDTAHIAKMTSNIEMQAAIEKAFNALVALLPKVISLATGK